LTPITISAAAVVVYKEANIITANQSFVFISLILIS
jgi:hypothetical protein